MDNHLAYFATPDVVRSMIDAKPLDSMDPLTIRVQAQNQLLSDWTGTTVELVGTDRGTCAHGPTRIIGVDINELDRLFKGFAGDLMDSAVFFALAHEWGHCMQAVHLPQDQLAKLDPVVEEAHADILGGVWMGVRLHLGEARLPDYLRETGLRLKGSQKNYPTPYQRACIIERGMADTLWLTELVDPRIPDADYTPIRDALKKQDVCDLLNTAKTVLDYTPEEEPS